MSVEQKIEIKNIQRGASTSHLQPNDFHVEISESHASDKREPQGTRLRGASLEPSVTAFTPAFTPATLTTDEEDDDVGGSMLDAHSVPSKSKRTDVASPSSFLEVSGGGERRPTLVSRTRLSQYKWKSMSTMLNLQYGERHVWNNDIVESLGIVEDVKPDHLIGYSTFVCHKVQHVIFGAWFSVVWMVGMFSVTYEGFTQGLFTCVALCCVTFSVLYLTGSQRNWKMIMYSAALLVPLVVGIVFLRYFDIIGYLTVRLILGTIGAFGVPRLATYISNHKMDANFLWVSVTYSQFLIVLPIIYYGIEWSLFLTWVVPCIVFCCDKTSQIFLELAYFKSVNLEGVALGSILVVTILESIRFICYALICISEGWFNIISNLTLSFIFDVIIQSRYFSYVVRRRFANLPYMMSITPGEWRDEPKVSGYETINCHHIDAMFTAAATLPEYSTPWAMLLFFNFFVDCPNIRSGRLNWACGSWIGMQLASEVAQLFIVSKYKFERLAVIVCVGKLRLFKHNYYTISGK